MIVSCPACESRFEVDREQLGYDGRVVRCGKCGNCWHQMPENEPAAAAAVAEDLRPPRRRAAPPPPRKSGGLALGWLLLLLFVGGVAAGAWFGREQIVAQVPQMAELYALAGIPVGTAGQSLRIGDVNVDQAEVGGETVVTVRGVVTNISDRKQVVPMLRAQLTDQSGTVLTEWSFDPPRGELDAGASASFETQTRNPPEGAQNLSINFAGS